MCEFIEPAQALDRCWTAPPANLILRSRKTNCRDLQSAITSEKETKDMGMKEKSLGIVFAKIRGEYFTPFFPEWAKLSAATLETM